MEFQLNGFCLAWVTSMILHDSGYRCRLPVWTTNSKSAVSMHCSPNTMLSQSTLYLSPCLHLPCPLWCQTLCHLSVLPPVVKAHNRLCITCVLVIQSMLVSPYHFCTGQINAYYGIKMKALIACQMLAWKVGIVISSRQDANRPLYNNMYWCVCCAHTSVHGMHLITNLIKGTSTLLSKFVKEVVGYVNRLDNILPTPQNPHYPRGLYTSTRAHYIQERWDTHTHTLVHWPLVDNGYYRGSHTLAEDTLLTPHTHTHTCTHAHTHAHTHVCTHAHAHTQPQGHLPSGYYKGSLTHTQTV